MNEPSVIRYTTDGTKPDETSALWDSTGPREPGEVFRVTSNTTFRWMATDINGNVSVGVKILQGQVARSRRRGAGTKSDDERPLRGPLVSSGPASR